jgi:hypothetical protein
MALHLHGPLDIKQRERGAQFADLIQNCTAYQIDQEASVTMTF